MDRGRKGTSWIVVAGLGQVVVQTLRRENSRTQTGRRQASDARQCARFLCEDQSAIRVGDAQRSPVVSGKPSMMFKFCTAAPDAPLPRLSRTATRRACFVFSLAN